MPAVLTDAGRALIAAKLAAMETIDIARVKFGNPIHPDPNNPPVPSVLAVDVSDLVHTVNGGITAGVINDDQVAYTVFLDAAVGAFQITQVGFFHVDGGSETLVMLANVPPVNKVASAGNNYKHTEILSIQAAAEASGVVIPAETWQLDHTARFRSGENALQFNVSRLLGRFAALSGALLVSEIAPVLREDAEATTGWVGSSGIVELDAVQFSQGAGSLKISGQSVGALLTKTYGAGQDWSAANGLLLDILASSGTAIQVFIIDSSGNLSFWNITTGIVWTEHEALFAAPDGNNGTDADPSDVLAVGLGDLDAATVYNLDNIRTARLNDFALAAGDAILAGIGRTYAAATYATHRNDWNGDLAAPPALSPPVAGTRTDRVYLDVWMQPNGSTVDPFAEIVVSDAVQADYVDGAGLQHRVEPIAEILRTTAQRIAPEMLTDLRRDVTVSTTGAAQSRDEKGQADGYAALDGDGDVPDSQIPAGIQRTAEKGVANGYASLGADATLLLIQVPAQLQQQIANMAVREWTIRTSAADKFFLAVVWSPELRLFAAVAATNVGNEVMTSPDGINWTSRVSAADNNWRGIAWSPELGLFAVVGGSGTGNRVMTSPDGINWTSRTSAADNTWAGVAWSPELGLFAAVAGNGTGNRVMTSPDGINWTIRTSAADNNWRAIAWSPELGLFVAMAAASGGNEVMTSPDGINWTIRTSAAANDWRAIAWSPELRLFAAVAASGTGNRVMTSPDGINWTSRTSAADNTWAGVAWSPELGLFAAVAFTGTGNRVMTSPDGINWASRVSAADNNWQAIAWSPELGLFAAVATTGAGNRVMTSR